MNVIQNFMEDDLINHITQHYQKIKNNEKLESNEKQWDYSLLEGTGGLVNLLGVNELSPNVSNLIIEKFKNIPEFKNFVLDYCKLHIWNPGSGINWHNDNDRNGAQRIGATIYLNKQWKETYGGIFLYVENGEKKWYCPRYNDCIWFKSPMDHFVTMVTGVSHEPRLSIQLFWKKVITSED